jgi:hypothetical protein
MAAIASVDVKAKAPGKPKMDVIVIPDVIGQRPKMLTAEYPILGEET